MGASDVIGPSLSSPRASSSSSSSSFPSSFSSSGLRRERKSVKNFQRRESAKEIADDIVRHARSAHVYADGSAIEARIEKEREANEVDEDNAASAVSAAAARTHSVGYTSWPRPSGIKRQDSHKVELGAGIGWRGSPSSSPYDPFGDADPEDGTLDDGSADVAKIVRRASAEWRKKRGSEGGELWLVCVVVRWSA